MILWRAIQRFNAAHHVAMRFATLYAGIEKSGKHRKAEELIAAGVNIEILSESDFAEMIRLN